MRPSLSLISATLACVLLSARELPAQTDVIRGRVLGAEGTPLPNVRVTATSIPGNATRESLTNARGQYQIAFPGGQGDYVMGFALIGHAFRQFELKRTADQDVLIADTRLHRVQLDTVNVVSTVRRRVDRAGPPDVGGTERAIVTDDVPLERQGSLAAMAASMPGVTLLPGIDGDPDGFSVLGLSSEQNNVTLNGMRFGGGSLPRDAMVGSSIATSPFDVTRGGFSGAQLMLISGAGSNMRRRGASLLASVPQIQWTDPAARATGAQFTDVSLGGVASGPIKRNAVFYATSYELSRNVRDNQTLLNTPRLGLQTAGVAPDSVARFLDVLSAKGIPRAAGGSAARRTDDDASVIASLDVTPPNSASGSSFGVAVAGSVRRQRPVGASGVTTLSSVGGERSGVNLDLQARHDAYLGVLLTESSASVSTSRSDATPYVDLPAGRVLVSSALADGVNGVQRFSFGGAQGFGTTERSSGVALRNMLSWFNEANTHRLKLVTEFQYDQSTQRSENGVRGTFSFNSLDELQQGRPTSFTRTIAPTGRSSATTVGALSIGDSWRRTDDLQIQYGVRVERTGFMAAPAFNPDVEAIFGRRNDRIPNPWSISPRLGFSWALGTGNQVTDILGRSVEPRAVVRGGVGVFTNALRTSVFANALDRTGLPASQQQLLCVGDASPRPEWDRYLRDPASVPSRCADGSAGTTFSSSAPDVALIAPAYRPEQSVRATLSGSGKTLDRRLNLSVELTYSVNRRQGRTIDLNLRPNTQFTLDDEGARPVFAAPAEISPATGVIAAGAARVSRDYAHVVEMRSDLSSQTAQVLVRLSPAIRRPGSFWWNLAYTFTRTREQVGGFATTAGDPRGIDWSAGVQGPHHINYSTRFSVLGLVNVGLFGQLRSGMAYTPMVAGDVNGDGFSNDRAFIFGEASPSDQEVASAMRQLLAQASPGVRRCLESQRDKVAARNSCRTPWTSTAALNISLDRARFRIPSRADVSFSVSNPLGAADLMLHGADRLRGWGQSPLPDQALLFVRGFDPMRRAYRYEVNPRFGATRPQLLTTRTPVSVTASVRYDLGPTRERQSLTQQLDYGRRAPGSRSLEAGLRSAALNLLSNPLFSLLRLQDSLALTALQADSVAALNRRYSYQSDSLWLPVTRTMESLPDRFDEKQVYARYMQVRNSQLDLLATAAVHVRGLLTPQQRRNLPLAVANYLDPAFLKTLRKGSGLYVGSR